MIFNAFTSGSSMRMIRFALTLALFGLSVNCLAAQDAAAATDIIIPVNRSEVVTLPRDMEEVIIANPDVADVHVHGPRSVSIIGKALGQTTLRVLDKQDNILGAYNVIVSYDLPAIRRSLKKFLPYEFIELDVVNKNLALTGEVSSASAAQQAVSIVDEYVKEFNRGAVNPSSPDEPNVLNLMKVTAGQQVMLHVRVGEIQRTALKQLGVNLAAVGDAGQQAFTIGTGGGLGGLAFPNNGGTGIGSFTASQDTRGIFGFQQQTGSFNFNALIEALERDGLFKSLAEPNLVALSGEKAEFLAGGEFPIPVSQGSTGSLSNVTIEFRSFGVGVQFTPYVLSENRIRINVQPEVSELTDEGSVELNGFRVPALTTRRAKTTLELAPGESFMIAGLLSDKLTSQIDALPGLSEVPVLSALFRSTAFQRNETELVIAVTPYLVDPVKSADVRLPTDDFRPASFMESVFYGAVGTQNGDAYRISQTPQLEGPIGFMVD